MEDSSVVKVAEAIANLRKEAGETQKELADAIGVSNKVVSKWENRESEPNLANMVAIADHFGVSVDFLIRGEEFEQGIGAGKEFREAALDAFQEGINQVFRFVRKEYHFHEDLRAIPLVPPTGVRFGENEGDYTGISSNEIFMHAHSSEGNNMILTLMQNKANFSWMTDHEEELRTFFSLLSEPGMIRLVRLIYTYSEPENMTSRYAAVKTSCSEENASRLFRLLRFHCRSIEMPDGVAEVWSICNNGYLLCVFACAFEAFINPAQDGSNVIKMDFRPIHSENEAEGEEKE